MPADTERHYLDRLVAMCDTALAERGWRSQPTVLLHVVGRDVQDPPSDGDLSLAMAEIDEHPAFALAGFVAPEEWSAMGCSQLAWAAPIDDGCRPSRHPQRQRIRSTTLVGRDGHEVTVLRRQRSGAVERLGRGSGRVPDVLRRCLGLPSDPPDTSVAAFFSRLWLDAVAASPIALRWDDVARMHPAMAGWPPEHLIDAGRGQARATTWGDVRWQTVEGRWELAGMTAELAAWMDDGLFSRWVSPDPELLAGVHRRHGPSVARRAESALRQWQVW